MVQINKTQYIGLASDFSYFPENRVNYFLPELPYDIPDAVKKANWFLAPYYSEYALSLFDRWIYKHTGFDGRTKRLQNYHDVFGLGNRMVAKLAESDIFVSGREDYVFEDGTTMEYLNTGDPAMIDLDVRYEYIYHLLWFEHSPGEAERIIQSVKRKNLYDLDNILSRLGLKHA